MKVVWVDQVKQKEVKVGDHLKRPVRNPVPDGNVGGVVVGVGEIDGHKPKGQAFELVPPPDLLLAESIQERHISGPRIYQSGRIDGAGAFPSGTPFGRLPRRLRGRNCLQ